MWQAIQLVVLLRRGHSDWSASSGQPSYYFLWPAASGRARTECDIVLISLCWKKRIHLALKRSQYLIPQTFLCIMCALYLIFAWFSSCHFGLQYVAPISSPIVKWTAAALSVGALFFHWPRLHESVGHNGKIRSANFRKKNPITGPVYMSKAPRSTEYFDRGVSENFV